MSRFAGIVALVFVLALAVSATKVGRIVALPDVGACDDVELVRRAQRSDEWALEIMYRRYVRMVAGIAQRMLRNPADVDDVVQETFLIGFEQLGRLADPRALRGWLARIAVSRVHRRFRFQRWTKLWSRAELAACLEDQADASATQEQRTELALVDRALANMKLDVRTPWILRRVLGHELADVAAACDCSLATAKRRLAAGDAIIERHVKGAP